MKKYFMTLMALILGVGMLNAHPVDVNKAKMVGQQFVQANFELNRQNVDLELVYTGASTRGEACFYVFNLGSEGFVAVSANDAFRPIVGYSKEEAFDAQNINPELAYMLNGLIIGRTSHNGGEATPMVAAEWNSVMNSGRQLSFNGGREAFRLVETKWNQDYPYNYFCPQAQGGPGGRTYAGCVATAMGQVMKYWDHPLQGTGSHTDYNSGFGALSANFGNTTYDWDHMPNRISSSSTQEEIDAVATLLYHCGIAVDMHYAIDGSGAFSADVPDRIKQFFSYSTQAVYRNRDSYTYESWKDMLKESLDLGWPLYYSGHDPDPVNGGGHAFVCDGYDDSDHFCYNWGWGGSGDNAYWDFDQIDYNTSDGAIFNFVPTNIYNNTAQAPTNFTVTKTSETSQEANISWVNPSKTLSNTNLASIDQVVVKRDGKVIFTQENATPGADMSFVDSEVPCYSIFNYEIYVIVNGARGQLAKATEVFGPSCEWKILGECTNMTGWKDAKISVLDAAGKEVGSFTMTSSNPLLSTINVPLGHVSFAWKAGTDNVALSFKIKDATGAVVYEQTQAPSNTLVEGVFFATNNGCGNTAPAPVQGELFANYEDGNIVLTWNAAKTDYGFNVYRDGLLCGLVHETEFVDVDAAVGGHCYMVCALSDGGESEYSNEVCATAGEGCEPGSDLWVELQANFKPLLTWTAPDNENLSGYILYRKKNDGEYGEAKNIGANKTEYKETRAMEDGNWYYYRLVAVYQGIDCTSAPFKAKFGNEYFVKIYYSTTGVDDVANQQVSLIPNPTKGSFTVNAENLQQVMVYNAVGQLVLSQVCEGNSTVLDLGNVDCGLYMVKVISANGESIQKVSVIR